MEQAHPRCSACAEIAGDVEALVGRVLRNPTPAARADAATRIRQLWRA
jgi:hypothetical protein